MKKVLVVAAIAAMMMAPVSMAQTRAVGVIYPGEAGFVLPEVCTDAALAANGAAPCLALFPGLTPAEAAALLALVGGGAGGLILLAALQEAGLAGGDDASAF